jgi:hypothetical protein
MSLTEEVDPLPKHTFTHILIFNEKLALKNLFVPVEIAK